MTSRKPPSQRDAVYTERHQRRWLQSMSPGAAGGRFASAQPIPAGASTFDEAGDGDDETAESVEAFQDETTVVVTAATQTVTLTFEPLEHSEHVYWNGVYQPGSQWTRNGNLLTVLDSGRVIEAGDVLTVEYLYIGDGVVDSIGWEAEWKYLIVSEGDGTDRSGPSFDDSGWSTARGAFGNVVDEDGAPFAGVPDGWRPPNTVIGPPVDLGIWLRRSMDMIPDDATVTVEVRVDGDTTVYWNGNLVGTRSADGTVDVAPLSVSGAFLGGSNILAVHHVDDASDPSFDFTYIDVLVRWE